MPVRRRCSYCVLKEENASGSKGLLPNACTPTLPALLVQSPGDFGAHPPADFARGYISCGRVGKGALRAVPTRLIRVAKRATSPADMEQRRRLRGPCAVRVGTAR